MLNLPDPLRMPTPGIRRALLAGNVAANETTLLAWALFDWAVIAVAWTVMAVLESAWTVAFGTVVVASRLHALGVILHDACHQRRRERSNKLRLVEVLAGWPIASTILAMRYHHLRHHSSSGTAHDPYRDTVLARITWRRHVLTLRGALLPFWWTLRAIVAPLAVLVPRVRTTYGRAFLQDRSGRDLRDHPDVLACARADVAQLAAQTFVIGSASAANLPVLTFYVLPLMLAGVLNARRVIHEHAWLESERRSRLQQWETTVDHDLGFIGNAIFYPHNIGHHRLHHLYPTVSFIHLRRLAEEIRSAGNL